MVQAVPYDSRLVQSILLPTDFSPASDQAFAHALALALCQPSKLTIMHAGNEKPGTALWSRFPAVRETLARWGYLAADSDRSAVLDELGLKVKKVSCPGRSPVAAASGFLRSSPADLMVVATRRREGLGALLHRSVARSIARGSGTPTLFVQADTRRGLVSGSSGERRLRTILLPVARQPDHHRALEFARYCARALGTGQVAIRAVHVGGGRAPRLRQEPDPHSVLHCESRAGDAVDVVLAAAFEHDVELVVMATPRRGGLLDRLQGSPADRILNGLSCPLLVVPTG